MTRGQDVRDVVGDEQARRSCVLDMQIGNMGGVAVAIDLRLEARPGGSPTRRSCCCSTGRPTASSPSAPTPTPSW